jgi:Zn-dependent peptidase ImmA (M78 family)
VLRDFRQLPREWPKEFSPELVLLIRQAQARQEWLREFLIQEGEERIDFIGSATLHTPPVELANAIRGHFSITPRDQMDCDDRRAALNLWIEKAEQAGINVCRQGGIDSKEVRGFALSDDYAPFVFINSKDALAAQLFTLLHEVAHLALNESGISNLEGLEGREHSDTMRIEIYCNRGAGEVLIERDAFDQTWGDIAPQMSLEEKIEVTARRIKVSEEAIARRLLEMQIIVEAQYKELRNKYLLRWEMLDAGARSSSGFPHPNLLRVLRNGRAYTRTVLSAYQGGAISGEDASHLIGSKIQQFPSLAEFSHKG